MSKIFLILSYALVIISTNACVSPFKQKSSSDPQLKDSKTLVPSANYGSAINKSSSEIEKGFDIERSHLAVVRNPIVDKWIKYFQTTAHRSFIKWKERGEVFRRSIEEIFSQEGVPPELYYLALIESGFVPLAASPAHAVGPWQFLRETGEHYGLKVNDWIDQRRDPIYSTQAAAALLRDLNARFGDWYLALAAYNSGPRRIEDAIKKGRTRDFWELRAKGLLKKETGDFVPKVLAAVTVGSDPLQFGFPAKPTFTDLSFPESIVWVKRPIKLEEISRKLEIPISHLKEWNPELVRGITPPKRFLKGNGYPLRIAESYVQKFAQLEPHLKYLDVKDIRIHRITKGDTIAKLAKRYHVSVQSVLQINPQLSSKGMVIGMKVALPVPDSPT